MENTKFWLKTGSLAVLMAMPSLLKAQDGEGNGDWDVRLGAGVIYAPEYEGSDKYQFQALPLIDITWRDTIYFQGAELGGNFYRTDDLTLSFGVGYDSGRAQSDSIYLAGLGDIDGGAELSLGAAYEFGPAEAFAKVNKLLAGSEGLTAEFGVETRVPVSVLFGGGGFDTASNRPKGSVLTAGISAMWVDDKYNQSYFGVTTAQAATSVYTPYTASSGLKSVDLSLGLMVPLSDRWSAQGMLTYSRLIGDAADSPLVRDENQYGAALMIGYSF